jgi:HSP20 family protein
MALLPVIKRERVGNELTRFRNEMDNLFHSFFENKDWPIWEHIHWPAVDVADNDNEIIVKAEVPGCKADDIDISVHGNTLTISGEKKEEHQQKDKGYYHVERSYGSFRRDINLSAEIKADKIEASCKDGVLTLKLPKMESSKAVKVKVKGE